MRRQIYLHKLQTGPDSRVTRRSQLDRWERPVLEDRCASLQTQVQIVSTLCMERKYLQTSQAARVSAL